MSSKLMIATVVAGACLACLVAAAAGAAGGPPSVAAGPAFGFVPSHNVANAGAGKTRGHVQLLQWYGGPVMHSTTVVPVFWGSKWSSSSFVDDKVSGLDYLYSRIGGTPYAKTNGEYYDSSGNVNTTSIGKGSDLTDTSAAPLGAPSTSAVLAEVAKMTNNNPQAGAYYPVYSDQPRGSAGYCAWHSSGTINGKQVEFGFFFDLDGDPGCDPNSPAGLGHSQGLAALANVSGHELSEMLTDPQLNAWMDQRGSENSDKCAWTYSGTVQIGSQSWKIQGNWSNAAANANSGYANAGCIQTA
jgi:hypothetical protein